MNRPGNPHLEGTILAGAWDFRDACLELGIAFCKAVLDDLERLRRR